MFATNCTSFTFCCMLSFTISTCKKARLSAHVDQNHGLKFAAASRPPVATDRFLYFFAQTFAKLKATFDALEAARCVRTPWVREARVPYDHEFQELHVCTCRLGDGHPSRLRRQCLRRRASITHCACVALQMLLLCFRICICRPHRSLG